MRIRRRPPFSSSPSNPTPSPLSDPSFNALPAALLRRDATKDAAVYSTQELHQQGDLPTGACHGVAQGPNWSGPRHQRPVHYIESHANSNWCSSGNSHSSFCFAHPAGDGRFQVLRREEQLKREEDDDEESMVDSNKRCDDAKVNNSKNRSTSNGAGALILLEAAQRLEESAALAKKEASDDDDGDKGDGDIKLIKGKTTKARRRRPVSSTSNGCISDNESRGVAAGGGLASASAKAAAQVTDEDNKLLVMNGNSAAANATSNGKKRRSPAVLMEGSRCSRVNGRGWRCCQQTLVGYSLCEHHLGKGRLRSMSSVRGQIGATTRPKRNSAEGDATRSAATPPPSSALEQDDKQHDTHQQLPPAAAFAGVDKAAEEEGPDNNNGDTITRKKRKKMGMVKARSISSLLDGGVVEPPAEPSEVAKVLVPHETMV